MRILDHHAAQGASRRRGALRGLVSRRWLPAAIGLAAAGAVVAGAVVAAPAAARGEA